MPTEIKLTLILNWHCDTFLPYFTILILSLTQVYFFVLYLQRHRLKANWIWCYSHLVYNLLMFKLSHQLLLYTHDWNTNLILITKTAEFNCREIKDLIYNCMLRVQDLPTRWHVSPRELRYLNSNVNHGLFGSIVHMAKDDTYMNSLWFVIHVTDCLAPSVFCSKIGINWFLVGKYVSNY